MNGSVSPPGTFVLRRGLERLRTSAMVKQSLLVFSAAMVLNVCGFAAHAVASRELGVAAYGGLYALINAALIAALPVAFVAPVVAQLAAEFRALHDDSHLRGLTDSIAGGFTKLAVIYLVVATAGMIPFAHFLHVPIWSLPFVGLIAGVALFVNALRAIAQGTQDFVGYGFSNAVEGVAKVIGIVALIAVGLRLGGAVVGFLLGPLCALIYLASRLKRRYAAAPTHRVRYDWRRILNAGAGAAAATIAIALMGSADVILVKHYFPEHAAGLYAAASLGGKMLLYLVGFVPTVLLPQAADRHARGARTRDVLAGSLAMLVAVALCGLFVFYFFGLQVLHALVGHAFDGAAPLLVRYGVAMVLLALTNSLTFYGIATHRLAFTVPLFICTLGTLAAIVTFHPTLATVVEIMVVGNFAAALAVTISLLFQRNSSGRRSTV
jgi:O-antigen/teichoic acid export membrane protein